MKRKFPAYFGTNYVQYYGTDDSSKTHYLQKLEGGLTLTNGVVSQYTSTYRTVWTCARQPACYL